MSKQISLFQKSRYIDILVGRDEEFGSEIAEIEKMTEPTYLCHDKHESTFLIIYKVADQQKKYLVCEHCKNLKYFKKYIIEKIPIHHDSKKSVDLIQKGIAYHSTVTLEEEIT